MGFTKALHILRYKDYRLNFNRVEHVFHLLKDIRHGGCDLGYQKEFGIIKSFIQIRSGSYKNSIAKCHTLAFLTFNLVIIDLLEQAYRDYQMAACTHIPMVIYNVFSATQGKAMECLLATCHLVADYHPVMFFYQLSKLNNLTSGRKPCIEVCS